MIGAWMIVASTVGVGWLLLGWRGGALTGCLWLGVIGRVLMRRSA